MANGISLETYINAEEKTRNRIIFELLMLIKDTQEKQIGICETRFKKIESNKLKSGIMASTMGFVGGFIAILGKKLF